MSTSRDELESILTEHQALLAEDVLVPYDYPSLKAKVTQSKLKKEIEAAFVPAEIIANNALCCSRR